MVPWSRRKVAAFLLALGALAASTATRGETLRVVQVRSLVLFAPSLTDARLREQLQLLKPASAGLRERQVFVSVGVQSATAVETNELDRSIRMTLSPDVEETLRKRFLIRPSDFVVILVGKDGGEKRRWTAPVRFEELRDTIDAMPMRQDEMRHPHPPADPSQTQ